MHDTCADSCAIFYMRGELRDCKCVRTRVAQLVIAYSRLHRTYSHISLQSRQSHDGLSAQSCVLWTFFV